MVNEATCGSPIICLWVHHFDVPLFLVFCVSPFHHDLRYYEHPIYIRHRASGHEGRLWAHWFLFLSLCSLSPSLVLVLVLGLVRVWALVWVWSGSGSWSFLVGGGSPFRADTLLPITTCASSWTLCAPFGPFSSRLNFEVPRDSKKSRKRTPRALKSSQNKVQSQFGRPTNRGSWKKRKPSRTIVFIMVWLHAASVLRSLFWNK